MCIIMRSMVCKYWSTPLASTADVPLLRVLATHTAKLHASGADAAATSQCLLRYKHVTTSLCVAAVYIIGALHTAHATQQDNDPAFGQ
jgi:hypothetical protein